MRALPSATRRYQADDVIADRYRVLHLLGRGGMGEVYLVRDQRMEREVVLKLLAGGHDQLTRKRFAREMKTMARFSHPNIVAIYDHGEDGDTPWLTMEHVNGLTLRQYMVERAPLSPGIALTIADQVLNALVEAAEHGLVHRDLKPANIMLAAKSGGLELVKVLDFGIAKALTTPDTEPDGSDLPQTLTTPGALVGTPHYMAPEQVLGETVDTRTDIYALGCILYEMLTGKLPVDADTPRGMLLGHLQHKHVPIIQRSPDIDPSLDRFVHRALEAEKKDRFPDALTMKAELGGLPGGTGHSLGLPPPSSSGAVAVSDTVDSDDVTIDPVPARVSAELDSEALLAEPTLPGTTEQDTDESLAPDTEERSAPVPPTPPDPPRRQHSTLVWGLALIALVAVISLVAAIAWFLGQEAGPSNNGTPTAGPAPSVTLESPTAGDDEEELPSNQVEVADGRINAATSSTATISAATAINLLNALSDGAFIGSSAGSGSEWEITEDVEAVNQADDDQVAKPSNSRASGCPQQQIPSGSGGCIPVDSDEWPAAMACLDDGTNCYHLGYQHVETNKDLTIAYYHQACQRGDNEVCYYLGGLLVGRAHKGYRKHAMRAWQRGCKLGHAVSCSTMVSTWNGGWRGFPQDQKRATRLAVEICDRKGLTCQVAGQNYLEGNGVEQDLDLAYKYLNKACNEHGQKRSCRLLKSMNGPPHRK